MNFISVQYALNAVKKRFPERFEAEFIQAEKGGYEGFKRLAGRLGIVDVNGWARRICRKLGIDTPGNSKRNRHGVKRRDKFIFTARVRGIAAGEDHAAADQIRDTVQRLTIGQFINMPDADQRLISVIVLQLKAEKKGGE